MVSEGYGIAWLVNLEYEMVSEGYGIAWQVN